MESNNRGWVLGALTGVYHYYHLQPGQEATPSLCEAAQLLRASIERKAITRGLRPNSTCRYCREILHTPAL